jgi:hypothetical protein
MALLKWLQAKSLLARGLCASDWLALFEAWWILLGYSLVLRWVSYDRIDRSPENGSHDILLAERLQRLVLWASRLHLISMTCLVQACTLRRMAGRRGIEARVLIGAARISTGILAHAWVEVDGRPIGETDGVAERFNPLASMRV